MNRKMPRPTWPPEGGTHLSADEVSGGCPLSEAEHAEAVRMRMASISRWLTRYGDGDAGQEVSHE